MVAEGTNAIKAGVDQVQTDFDALKAAAKDDYQAPVTALQSALQELQAAVADHSVSWWRDPAPGWHGTWDRLRRRASRSGSPARA